MAADDADMDKTHLRWGVVQHQRMPHYGTRYLLVGRSWSSEWLPCSLSGGLHCGSSPPGLQNTKLALQNYSTVQYSNCGRGSQTSALASECSLLMRVAQGRTYPSLSGQVWGRLKSPASQPSNPVDVSR